MPTPPNYREFSPGTFLAGAVECFWTSTRHTSCAGPSLCRVIPDGCMDMLFDFADVVGSRASIVGTMTRPLTINATGPLDLFGVRFRPGGLSGFAALDATEFTDALVDLTNLWGPSAQEVWHRLGEASAENRIQLLQEALGARANRRMESDPFIQHCVTRIQGACGALRIADLEKNTGLSGRQLERKFARHLGISPKLFARVVRFKAAARAATRPDPPDWATLAGDLGYADQPHLVREFKAFAGLTPGAYLDANGYRHAPADR